MSKRPGRRRLWLPLAIAGACTAVAGIAYAGIPDSGGLIHGCYDKESGKLYVIDSESGATCKHGRLALTWNQKGPKGDRGPKGDPGPKGDKGDPGAPGAPGTGLNTPLSSGGSVRIDQGGIRILDKDGNVVMTLTDIASIHHEFEQFPGGLSVPLANGGRVQIDKNGATVFDDKGHVVSRFDEFGSTHNKPESFNSITLGNPGQGVQIDKHSITIYDANGNVVSSFDADGSTHNKSETFNFTDLFGFPRGKVVIGGAGQGIHVFDAAGKLATSFDGESSSHFVPETFFGGLGTTVSGFGVQLGKNSITIYDANGNVVSSFDENGSTHNKLETFNSITVPFTDINGNPTGHVNINRAGIGIFDANGNLLTSFGPFGSTHGEHESFNGGITVGCGSNCTAAQVNGNTMLTGNVVINGNLSVTGAKNGYVTDYALNGSSATLKQGEAVKILGSRPPVIGSIPVVVVGPAGPGDQVIGVVDELMDGSPANGSSATLHPGGPSVPPGQHLLVVTHGAYGYGAASADTRAIESGDSLSAGPVAGTLVRSQPIHAGGATFVAPGTSVGYALAGLRSGDAVIPVFVDPH